MVLKKLLRGSDELGRNVALLAGGTLLAQILQLLVSPVLTRIYSPADFGFYGTFTSVLSVLAVLATFQYSAAIPVARSSEDAASLSVFGLLLTFLVALIVLLLVPAAARVSGSPALLHAVGGPIPYFLAVSVLLSGSFAILNCWAIRMREYASMSRSRLSQAVGASLTQVVLAFTPLHHLGLVAGSIVSSSGGQGPFLTMVARRKAEFAIFRHTSLRKSFDAGRRYRSFATASTPSVFLQTLWMYLPVLVASLYYDLAASGQVSVAVRLIVLPMMLLGTSYSNVYRGESLRAVQEGRLTKLFDQIVRKCFRAAGLVAVAALAAPMLVPIIFGQEWRPAGFLILYLAPAYAAHIIAFPISSTSMLLDKQYWQLRLDLVRTTAAGAALLMPAFL
ncbi:MAG TPA: oligosaccharide flippase family protein, partial [Fimbriimonas sp.]